MLPVLKFVLLPLALAATIGLSVAAYLALGRPGLRWLGGLRIGLVTAAAILLYEAVRNG